jgi:hypothetical protein
MVIYKASQMGASEYAISCAMHAADQCAATVLYLFPTDTHVSDFSTARIGPAIEASAYLESIVVEGGAAVGPDGKKRGADRVTLKRVRDRFIYLRGSQVKPTGQAPQLKSIDADLLILDEVDEMDPRAPAIAVKRLGHSLIAEERWISTPTYPGMGIHAKWLESDMREWHLPCGHCGERQPLTIGSVVTAFDDLERPVAWHGQAEGRAYAACRKCGKEIDRSIPGEWIATYPGRDLVGFHLTKLFSAHVRLLDIVESLTTTDETKRREAYNQDLGEPYTPRGGQLTDDVLKGCQRDYAHGLAMIETEIGGQVTKSPEKTVMGVDVGKVLHVVIRGPRDAESGERPQRWAGEVESFERLPVLMRTYNVSQVVIDALPETRKAREFQASQRSGVVWLAYYVTQKAGTKKSEPEQWDRDNGVVNLDRTRTMDATFARFFEQENTLPANARDLRDYFAHMKAPVRVLEDGPGGEKVASYVESGPDHFAHAENYCMVASSRPAGVYFK